MQYSFLKILLAIAFSILVFIIPSFLRKSRKKGDTKTRFQHSEIIFLDDCEIISSNFRNQRSDIGIMNPLGTVLDKHTYSNDYYQDNVLSSYVKYSFKGNVFVVGPIRKDSITIKALFQQKKFTYIYYDSNNHSNHFLDLEFLEE